MDKPIPNFERLRAYRYKHQLSTYKGGKSDFNGFITKKKCPILRREQIEKIGECEDCKSKEDLTSDHIVPIRMGGSTRISNIRVLCRSCNMERGEWIKIYLANYYPRLLVPWKHLDWSPDGEGIQFLRGGTPAFKTIVLETHRRLNDFFYPFKRKCKLLLIRFKPKKREKKDDDDRFNHEYGSL